ncbi:hypothetical protein B0H14DRAFT_2650892 [Mycena olivaceomarginata]|nr:hypothetical protein B0H14DRAFT_2650892 [Mycena olivaceomarginata]
MFIMPGLNLNHCFNNQVQWRTLNDLGKPQEKLHKSLGDKVKTRPSSTHGMEFREGIQEFCRRDKCAVLLKGKAARRVVKQTVMATVYDPTFVARDQVKTQLKDRKDLPEPFVLAAIGDLFPGTKHIQPWLTVCARLICKLDSG